MKLRALVISFHVGVHIVQEVDLKLYHQLTMAHQMETPSSCLGLNSLCYLLQHLLLSQCTDFLFCYPTYQATQIPEYSWVLSFDDCCIPIMHVILFIVASERLIYVLLRDILVSFS